jgi:hypothetical protein
MGLFIHPVDGCCAVEQRKLRVAMEVCELWHFSQKKDVLPPFGQN